MRMHIVGIAGREHRLAQLIGRFHDIAEDLFQIVDVQDGAAVDQVPVAFERLHLDIIVKFHRLFENFMIARMSHFEHFPVLT